jgi:hypothetical protein
MRILLMIIAVTVALQGSALAAPPTVEDVNSFERDIEEAGLIGYTMLTDESAQLDLVGEVIPASDKEKLRQFCHGMDEEFGAFATRGAVMVAAMEAYQGDDWEKRYGKTGLWRRLKKVNGGIIVSKSQMMYYLALLGDDNARDGELRKVISQLDALRTEAKSTFADLLEARSYLRLVAPTADDKDRAIALLKGIVSGDDKDSEWPEAFVELYRSSSSRDPKTLEQAWKAVNRPGVWEGPYARLHIALAAWESGRSDWLENLTTKTYYGGMDHEIDTIEYEDLHGEGGTCALVIAERRMKRDGVKWIGPYAAELIAWSAIGNDIETHGDIIEAMAAVPQFRRGSVLYALGRKREAADPNKAVELMLEGIKGMKSYRQKNPAEYAARLAYNLFTKDRTKCSLAKDALALYMRLAEKSPDEQLNYCYYTVCKECGDANEAGKTLEKTAKEGTGEYQRMAKYQLALKFLDPDKEMQPLKALPIIEEVMAGGGELGRTATLTWCRLTMNADANEGPRKVLAKLAQWKELSADETEVKLYALIGLGQVDKAVLELKPSYYEKKRDDEVVLYEVMEQFLDTAEKYEQSPDYRKAVKNCYLVAKNCSVWDPSPRGYPPMAAEAAILLPPVDKDTLASIETIIAAAEKDIGPNHEPLIRAKARMLMLKQDWQEAGAHWGRLCERLIYQAKGDQRSWQWWRAKYYQILCWSKGKDATKEELARRIEVIRSSCGPVPELWEKKLKAM